MFGMGIGELLIIMVVALLVVGPEKLPNAAKSISKGIRDLRKQTRELQQSLEDDTEIGDAFRDLKSALRGEDPPPKPRRRPDQPPGPQPERVATAGAPEATATAPAQDATATTPGADAGTTPDADATATTPAPGAPAFPEPVIRTPGTAIARGSTETKPDAGDPTPDAAARDSIEKKAHG